MPRKRKEQADNTNFKKAFPTVIRKLMEENGVTQQALADYLGKTRQAISYYCDGSSSPDWEAIVKIADYFDVSTDYLLGRTKDSNRQPCAVDALDLSSDAIDWILRENKNPDRKTGFGVILRVPSFQAFVAELCGIYYSSKAKTIYDFVMFKTKLDMKNSEPKAIEEEFSARINKAIESNLYGNPVTSMLITHNNLWKATKSSHLEYGRSVTEGFSISELYMLKAERQFKKLISDIEFVAGVFKEDDSSLDRNIAILVNEHQEKFGEE